MNLTDHLREYVGLQSRRRVYERDWQDIIDLVRPMTSDVSKQQGEGSRRTDQIFDSTAPDAVEELAAGLHSYLTNPNERWFTLGVPGYNELGDDADAMAWLEQVADVIYGKFQDDRSNFNTSLHEGYLDLSSFGNIVMYQEKDEDYIAFQGFPLTDCWFSENAQGKVDRMYRRSMMNSNMVRESFVEIPKKLGELMTREDKSNKDREYEIVHCVIPRSGDYDNRYKGKMRYSSVWIAKDTTELIEEGGYRTFPYHCSRWVKLPKEPYGRGPAHKVLPSIKMVNKMKFVLIKAAQKITDPPLQANNDGFLLPIATSPGALIWKEPGTEPIVPLETKGNIPVGIEMINQERDQIRSGFYADWLKMEKENKEMTAYEVADRRDEKLRLMAPMLGRQQSELLGPLISRAYDICSHAGWLPPAPQSLSSRKLSVVYVSPAARAQNGSKANDMSRFLQDVIPLAQSAPDVLDAVDMDSFTQEMANARGVTRKILRSQKDIAAIRDQRGKMQQAQQMAEIAEPASKAMKNVADAQAAGMQI